MTLEPSDRRSQTSDLTIYAKLSARELEVAGLTLQGFTYTQIADQLCISPHTVKSYLMAAYSKLGVSSKRELSAALKQPRNEVSAE